ncbi:MAG: hypothetical protein A3J97_08355 [Spirochaetes bacterium RIFOXYC1_FULL_54_7]|nr:MAG: hypothetical protein A3J97_08355 [Spirochaetes bacterium RIFOXYC1_FULL_54_7]
MKQTDLLDFVMDDNIYASHPSPNWARRNWISLNGEWSLASGGKSGTVIVPFSIGTPASRTPYRDRGLFVYSRTFDIPVHSPKKSYLLHIGASDYQTTVVLNGHVLGSHTGGYSSFSFEIGEWLQAADNRLELRVRDSRSMEQVRGKQTFLSRPFYVWYTGTTGIWQPVWIEETGPRYLERASARADFTQKMIFFSATSSLASGKVHNTGITQTSEGAQHLTIDMISSDRTTFCVEALPTRSDDLKETTFRVEIPFDAIKLDFWSPERPFLYKLRFTLYLGTEKTDEVESYAGFRSLDWSGKKFRINGKPQYLRMVLVQGYYPEGGYTPLSYQTMAADIRSIKDMGYNGARLHQKIESPYFHYLCDRFGLLTSYEMPSFYRGSQKAFHAYESELREIVARDSMHPSAVMWMLFNETWGIWGLYGRKSKTRRFVLDMVNLVKKLDPERPVIDNSGWEHLKTDILDFHHYLQTSALAREAYADIARGNNKRLHGFSILRVILFYLLDKVNTETRAVFLDQHVVAEDAPFLLSEYGGFGWYKNSEGASVVDSIERYTRDCVESGIFCGYCLTQLYDVEGEVNGLLTADRNPKVDPQQIKAINKI